MSKEPKRNVYVGHRYVPKIIGEWDKQETYEGLCIVTHQGTSYTSKKRVPVGIDISNEEYWVVTGNYNEQVENYRQEVRDMGDYVDGEVDSLTNYVDGEVDEVKTQLVDTGKNLKHISYVVSPIENEDFGDTIQTMYNSMPENTSLKIAEGTYYINTKLLFDRSIDIDASGVIFVYTGDSYPAITVEKGNTKFLNVTRPTRTWTDNSIGILFKNINQSIQLQFTSTNFYRGVVIEGDGYGNSYNKYFINSLWNNKESLVVTSKNGGWANENMIFGGRFAWTSDNTTTEGNIHILIDYVDYSNNNNHFYGCSLESASDNLGYAIKVIRGRLITFRDLRFEGVRKVLISEGSYYTTIDTGYDLFTNQIENNGAGTYIRSTGKVFDEKTNAPTFKQSSSAGGELLVLMNSLNNQPFSFLGNGDFRADGRGFFRRGFDFYSQESNQKRQFAIVNGNPEGELIGNPGSLAIDRRGYLYIKTTGFENNEGWKRVLTEE